MFTEQEKRTFQLLERIANSEQLQDYVPVYIKMGEDSDKNNIKHIKLQSYWGGARFTELVLEDAYFVGSSTTFSCMKDRDGSFDYHKIKEKIRLHKEREEHTIERRGYDRFDHRFKNLATGDEVDLEHGEDGKVHSIDLNENAIYRDDGIPCKIVREQGKLIDTDHPSHFFDIEEDTYYLQNGDKKLSFEEEKERLLDAKRQYGAACSRAYSELSDSKVKEALEKTESLVTLELEKKITRLEKSEKSFRRANELIEKCDNSNFAWYSESELEAVADKLENYLENQIEKPKVH